MSERFYGRRDWVAGAVTGAVALAGYWWTLAPSVTLEDSGEFLTAAYSLGVPHPPGYPVWTILAWLWCHLLPIGNIAWRINLMSAFFGASACALATLLVSKSGQAMCEKAGFLSIARRPLIDVIVTSSSICAGLLLAFSPVMWSQAVIAEVYGLNAFCLMATLVVLYRWSFEPERVWRLCLAAFIWGVGLTVHQTLVLLVIAFPMFIWLTDRKFGRCVLAPILLVGLAGLAVAAKAASGFPLVMFIALAAGALYWLYVLLWDREWTGPGLSVLGVVAFGAIVGGLALKFLENDKQGGPLILAGALAIAGYAGWVFAIRNSRPDDVTRAKRTLAAYLAVVLGLSLYGYLFVASNTNPPMNWGHCSQWDGFKQHFTRGQYDKLHLDRSWLRVWEQFNMFTEDLLAQFTLVCALLALLVMFFVYDLGQRDRNWLKFLLVGFLFLGLGFIFLSNPAFEKQKQFTDRVFFLPCHCIYALWIGDGLILGLGYVFTRKPAWQPASSFVAVVVLLMPALSVWRNWPDQEERGHNFGYRFGYALFKPGGGYPEMDRGAILFGGTDPGRFVSTYMIFVESFAPPSAKTHDPKRPDSAAFDRRDVYIMTQNALADATYMACIRDHYDFNRPRVDEPETLSNRSPLFRCLYRLGWKLLGRDAAYPAEPIWIPSDRDSQQAFQKYIDELQRRPLRPGEDVRVEGGRVSVQGVTSVMAINAILTKEIFEQNKDKHSFYVEESYVIPWMYPYLEPYGIIFKINKDPLDTISPDKIERDTAYWNALFNELMNDLRFHRDDVAQKTFSKLRSAIGGLYASRHLMQEAESALRQAVQLCPESPEANFRLTQLYVEAGRFDDAVAALEFYRKKDPRNPQTRIALLQILQIKQAVGNTQLLEQQLQAQPNNIALALELARLYAARPQVSQLDKLVNQLLASPDLSQAEFFRLIQLYVPLGRTDRALQLLTMFVQRYPDSAIGWYSLALVQGARANCTEALPALERALALDAADRQIHKLAQQEPNLQTCREDPRFQKLFEKSEVPSRLPFRITH